jgi:LmbE family N-acetylglucosaminyl deacetylase
MQDISPLVLFGRKSWRHFVRLLGKAARSDSFRRNYAVSAVVILCATVILWVVLGARLQLHNADQLSDPYMFSSWATFHGAFFPGSHTFLFKWPIFWLLGVFGVSSLSLLVATLAVVLLTVATLVVILYKIDRRPLVFGTVCLGLALALLLVPAQPYAGGILPVNMAMLTTRNLEYAVYLAALVLFARANHLRSRSFALGTVLLGLLIASDKLFMSLSVGGALLALVVYALVSNWSLTAFAVRWLAGGVAATIGAFAALFMIAWLHLTHLVNGSAAGPYGLVHSAKNLLLGIVYSILGLFTNGGANPAYDNTVLSQLPGNMAHRLWSFSGVAYVAAFCVLLYALMHVWRLVWSSLKASPRRVKPPAADLLALSLIWSTVAAFGVFILTDHYYAVDARYLTVGLFALIVTVSVGLRRHRWQWPEDLLLIACGLVIAIALSAFTAVHIAHGQLGALSIIEERNSTVTAALKHHKVDVLVGDYWRVLPIKLASHGTINAMPLGGCTQPTSVLTSSVWQPDLAHHSFAYLVTLDGSLTDFPDCSLAQITAEYGRPNATQIISGTLAKPTEALLFYDRGGHKPTGPVAAPVTILPVTTDKLMGTSCDAQTIMNVVAHQDDDLLFTSPDLLHDIQAGHCVRTVFLTAGDSGNGKLYWLGRQLGSEAAYDSMIGRQYTWVQRTVQLGEKEYVTIATPQGNPKISLVFFNLPDGDLQGQGFEASHYQSLAKLKAGVISSIRTVDGQSTYTVPQLTAAISQLMALYHPAEIRTQADVPSDTYPDHSDHVTTGQFTELAAAAYNQTQFGGAIAIPVVRYIGYPIHGYPGNVSGNDLSQKEAAFLAYARYDGGVCHTLAECARTPTYGAYISRQYTEDSVEQ